MPTCLPMKVRNIASPSASTTRANAPASRSVDVELVARPTVTPVGSLVSFARNEVMDNRKADARRDARSSRGCSMPLRLRSLVRGGPIVEDSPPEQVPSRPWRVSPCLGRRRHARGCRGPRGSGGRPAVVRRGRRRRRRLHVRHRIRRQGPRGRAGRGLGLRPRRLCVDCPRQGDRQSHQDGQESHRPNQPFCSPLTFVHLLSST